MLMAMNGCVKKILMQGRESTLSIVGKVLSLQCACSVDNCAVYLSWARFDACLVIERHAAVVDLISAVILEVLGRAIHHVILARRQLWPSL